MTTETAPDIGTSTQTYRIFIRATPQAIWDAITDPTWTENWGYGLRDEYDLRPGAAYRGMEVYHDVTGRPLHAAIIAGHTQGPSANAGWTWILSDLKTAVKNRVRMAS